VVFYKQSKSGWPEMCFQGGRGGGEDSTKTSPVECATALKTF
jgi:hypothetical protein